MSSATTPSPEPIEQPGPQDTSADAEHPITAPTTDRPNAIGDRILSYMSARPGRNSAPVIGLAQRRLLDVEMRPDPVAGWLASG